MQISLSIFDWLVEGDLISQSNYHQNVGGSQVKLDNITTQAFEYGVRVAEILKEISSRISTPKNPFNISISGIQKKQNPASKVFNWNLIQKEYLPKFQIDLDTAKKTNIIAGKHQDITWILEELYKKYGSYVIFTQADITMNVSPPIPQNKQIKHKVDDILHRKKIEQQVPLHPDQYNNEFLTNASQQEQIDLQGLDISKSLGQSNSLLEFLILNLYKNFNFQHIQEAVNLMSNGGKLLIQIQQKGGKKGNFIPIRNWLRDLISNMRVISQFVDIDNSNIINTLKHVEGGLQSIDEETVVLTILFLIEFSKDLYIKNNQREIYEWAIKTNGGIENCVRATQKHKGITLHVGNFIISLCTHNLQDLISLQLKKHFETIYSYMKFIMTIFEPLTENRKMQEQILKSGILDQWIKMAVKMAENDGFDYTSQNDKQLGQHVLVNIWIKFSLYIEKQLGLDNKIIDLLKRSTRSPQNAIKYTSFSLFFKILDQFATDRNPKAQIIYKTLTFLLIENHQDIDLREFFLRNFSSIFKKFTTIPIDILVDPYIKQMHVSGNGQKFFMNICDVEFLHVVTVHKNLNLKLAIIVGDMIIKVYLNNFIWSNSLFGPIQVLINKFLDYDIFQQFIQKTTQVMMKDILDSYIADQQQKIQDEELQRQQFEQSQIQNKSKKKKNSKNPQIDLNEFVPAQSNEMKELIILSAQRRALIIELIKYIINLKNYQINDKLKIYICKTFLELKDKQIPSKGVLLLVSLFGNPLNVIDEFQRTLDQGLLDKDLEGEENQYNINLNLNNNQNNNYKQQSNIVSPNQNSVQKYNQNKQQPQQNYNNQQQQQQQQNQNNQQQKPGIQNYKQNSNNSNIFQVKKQEYQNDNNLKKALGIQDSDSVMNETPIKPNNSKFYQNNQRQINNNQNQNNNKNNQNVGFTDDQMYESKNYNIQDQNMPNNNQQIYGNGQTSVVGNNKPQVQSSRLQKNYNSSSMDSVQFKSNNPQNKIYNQAQNNQQQFLQAQQKNNDFSLPQIQNNSGLMKKNNQNQNKPYVNKSAIFQQNNNNRYNQQNQSVNYQNQNMIDKQLPQHSLFMDDAEDEFDKQVLGIQPKTTMHNKYINYLPNPHTRKMYIESLDERNADIKNLNYIDQQRGKYEDQQLEKQMKLINKQLNQQKLLNQAQNNVQIKNAAMNVGKQLGKNYTGQVVFDEGQVNPQLIAQKETILQQQLFVYGEAEQRDQQAINVTLQRYKEGIKYLFRKYSNSTDPKARQRMNFNNQIQKVEKISFADINRMSKDHDFSILCSKEEIHEIVKWTNHSFGVKTGDIYSLDLNAFPEFIVQLAFLCFSRPPRDFRGQHMGYILDALFHLAASAMIRRNENPTIILKPDTLMVRGDQKLIQEYNEMLREDPDIEIPEKYKKYRDQELGCYYQLGPALKNSLPENYVMCYEIINDLVFDIVGSNIIEPKVYIDVVTKIKPLPIQTAKRIDRNKPNIGDPYQNYEFNNQNQDQEQGLPVNNNNQQQNGEQMPNPLDKKKKNNRFKSKYRQQQQEQEKIKVPEPEWLQEMKKPNKKIVNKALKQKLDEEEKQRYIKQQKDLNMLERKLELRQQLEENYKEKLEFDRRKLEEIEKINVQRQAMEQQRQVKQKEQQQENRKLIQEYKQLKDEENKLRLQAEQELVEQMLREKKNYNDLYLQEQKQKLQQQFQQQEEKRLQEQRLKKKEKYEQKAKEQKFDAQMDLFMMEQKDQQQFWQQFLQQVDILEMNPKIQQTFKRYHMVFKTTFDHYLEYSDVSVQNKAQKILSFKGFMHFISNFSIQVVVKQENLQQMFNHLVRNKLAKQQGLDYKEFKYAIIRICVMAQPVWDIIFSNFKEVEDENENIFDQENGGNQNNDEEQGDGGEEQQQEIELPMNSMVPTKVTSKTLLGFLFFLRLPLISKSMVMEALRQLKNEQLHGIVPYKKKQETIKFLETNNLQMHDDGTSNNGQGNVFNFVQQEEMAFEYKQRIKEQKKLMYHK